MSRTTKTKSFEAALAEIEQIIDEIDSGEMPLDKVVAKFKQCGKLIGACRAQLEEVEQQIKVLGEDLQDKAGDDA